MKWTYYQHINVSLWLLEWAAGISANSRTLVRSVGCHVGWCRWCSVICV